MLQINNEIYKIEKISIDKYKYTRNGNVVDNTYKIKFFVNDNISFVYYNFESLEFFNKFELNKEYLINEYIDQNGLEIKYNGKFTKEFAFDNEVYLTKIGDNKFAINIIMNSFINSYHGISYLKLKEIIDFNVLYYNYK